MELTDHMNRFEGAIRDRNDLETAWCRHILTMAAGVLALTVSLVSSVPESMLAGNLLLGTWGLLVVAVCSGCAATYAQANAMNRAVRAYGEEIATAQTTGRPVGTVNVQAASWFRWAKSVMVVSFVLSVLFLSGYGFTAIHVGSIISSIPIE